MAFTSPAKDLRSAGYGLAALSFGLGLAEILAPNAIARGLGAPQFAGMVRGFGVREVISGAGFTARPTASLNAWGRVAGDVLDLAALAMVMRAPGSRKGAAWGGIALVSGALLADIIAGIAMRRDELRREGG